MHGSPGLLKRSPRSTSHRGGVSVDRRQMWHVQSCGCVEPMHEKRLHFGSVCVSHITPTPILEFSSLPLELNFLCKAHHAIPTSMHLSFLPGLNLVLTIPTNPHMPNSSSASRGWGWGNSPLTANERWHVQSCAYTTPTHKKRLNFGFVCLSNYCLSKSKVYHWN